MGLIYFNLYLNENNENTLKTTINIDLDEKIYDLRQKILNLLFKETNYNYVKLNNITNRVYKDYGLLFFDKGLLPDTVDNFTVGKFTIEERTFDFLVEGCNKEETFKSNINNNISSGRGKGVYNPNKRFNPQYEEKVEKYVYNEDDFPSLGS